MTPPSFAKTAVAAPARSTQITVAGARRSWANKFRACGIDSPELDARMLVGHALGLDHAALAAAAAARSLNIDEENAIGALAQRRLAREPVARILGWKEFWSLPLRVDASTLVPRPETETVVEAALAAIDARWSALAAAAHCRPRHRVRGDSAGASLRIAARLRAWAPTQARRPLSVARDNARRLGLARARFVACDMAAALRGPFDLIVSNPPYIASADIATLAPEVRDFEPRRALDGGADGLDFYRAIAAAAPALLAPGGVLIVELGAGQAQAVGALFAAAGLAPLPPRPDLNGVPRALLARKRA